ncbi:MAG: PilZ domain-containing protein [Desulfobacteraceae bacterium]|nr:MAG: PilZ domain-containing protein [Desulfobacteraceae bacterium]
METFESKLVGDRRKHKRKSIFMVIDYSIKDRTYKDFIKNISTGGVFIETRMAPGAGQKIVMSFTLPNCRKHVKIAGEIAQTNLQGIGVKFMFMEQVDKKFKLFDLETSHQSFLAKTNKEKKMTKIRKRRIRWNASNTHGVVGYKLYWAAGKEVTYDSDFAEVGNVTEVILPDDVSSFPLDPGDIELGVVAVDHMGNESDMTKLTAPFDFSAPDAPTGLTMETV